MSNFSLNSILVILLSSIVFCQQANAQELDDLMNDMTDEAVDTNYTFATFKATRVINSHSIENLGEGVLDFRIAHRFGTLNSGFYELFGLDNADMRMSFEYGLSDRITLGVGRSGGAKSYDGFTKIKLLKQSSGARIMPIAISYLVSSSYNFVKSSTDLSTANRLDYCHQLIIARKFNERFSMQVSPGILHRNLVATKQETNDIIHFAGAARYMLTGSVGLNIEYIYVLANQLESSMTNSFTIGFDIETGGHVFQLHFTNSLGMFERAFIAQTNGNWLDGDIHFGFNISRVFTVKR